MAELSFTPSRNPKLLAFEIFAKISKANRKKLMENQVSLQTIETPLGTFGAVFSPKGLSRLTFPSEPLNWCEEWAQRWYPQAQRIQDDAFGNKLNQELNAYLAGDLREFSVPVEMCGTAFQKQVWQALQGIGYGQIRSYGQIAVQIGNKAAVRAVGTANGANPVPIIVPCHRVIGSNGTLTGYAGGLELKQHLLKLEGGVLL